MRDPHHVPIARGGRYHLAQPRPPGGAAMSANRFSIVLGALLVLLLAGIGVGPAPPGPVRNGLVTHPTRAAGPAGKEKVNGRETVPEENGAQMGGAEGEADGGDNEGAAG